MRAVIGCDSFLSLRNIRNGNLGELIEGLHVLVDPNQLPGSQIARPPKVSIGPLVDFDPYRDPELGQQLSATYLARKAYYDGWTLWNQMRGSSYRAHRESGPRRTASLAKAGARFAGGWLRGALGKAQYGRRICADTLRRHPLASEYRRLFVDRKQDVVAAFSVEGYREMLLVETANDVGIPTAVMIRSRDNLSAKIPHLPYAQMYLVWSESTRRVLLQIYPEIEPKQVVVTGSPQFDRHLDPEYRLGREQFFSLVNLDPDRPLIVYTMATPGLIDHEAEIVQHLADAAHSRSFKRRAQLLVRGHPRMFGSNIRLLHREYPEARAYPQPAEPTYRSPEHEAELVRLILEDEPVHLATLAYQDVQVNVCGTMTIDSAIHDKPTVNVFYDLVDRIPSGLSVRRFYERSDVKQMMAYGASRLARDPQECVRLINQYLDDPNLDAEGRKRAREQDCGPLDGQAGERIAANLLNLTSGRADHESRL
ncbi:MAG TPA: hypothetical protein VHQ95_16740 [Pyrinomonadaceae bacterium]|nr:hypothetical protein [Pyrinomonadaceae bacterium]